MASFYMSCLMLFKVNEGLRCYQKTHGSGRGSCQLNISSTAHSREASARPRSAEASLLSASSLSSQVSAVLPCMFSAKADV